MARIRRTVHRAVAAVAAVGFAMLCYVYLTLPDIRVLASEAPPSTAFMELRAAEAAREGRSIRRVQRWVPYSRISPHLKRAVLVTEDAAFWDHEGIDVDQIRESIRISWEQGRTIRGASTITQQLAKNLYLSPSRDPLRKLRELIIARRLEAALPKVRIFEIYLNVIEWGDGIWGAEAAARTYFGVSAAALTAEQAALLAGAIISPRVLSPARPTGRLHRRQRLILSRMGSVAPPAVVAATPPAPSAGPSPVDDAPEPLADSSPLEVLDETFVEPIPNGPAEAEEPPPVP